MLRPGEPAPDFEAPTWDGRRVRLSELRGRPLWLGFYRYASCPLCNLRIHELRKRYDALHAAGLEVLAVFQSPPESVARYVGRQTPPFPLLCDPEEKIYRTYGLRASLAAYLHPGNLPRLTQATAMGYLIGRPDGTKTRIPGDFLIDRDQILRVVYLGEKISDHIAFEKVDQFLRETC